MSTPSQLHQKVLAIFGATGNQGGSILHYFATHPNPPYKILALTRNPTSPKALALKALHPTITLLKADLSSPSTLHTPLSTATAVFLVTDFWALLDAALETQQAKSALDIISNIPTIEHVIWSSLPSIRDLSQGKYSKVVHLESKADATKWVQSERPELWARMTTLWMGTYYQLWLQEPYILSPRPVGSGEEKKLVMRLPADANAVFPRVDVRDTGVGVASILEKGVKELGGKIVSLVADDTTTLGEMLEQLGGIVGLKTEWERIGKEEFMEGLRGGGLPEFLVEDICDVVMGFADPELQGRILQGDGVVEARDILVAGGTWRSSEEYMKGEDWTPILTLGQ